MSIAHERLEDEQVERALREIRLRKEYGLPNAIRSDNGAHSPRLPWAAFGTFCLVD
jgi:hypothetical protein